MGKYNYMNLNQKMIRIRKKVPKLIRKRYSEDVTYDFVKLDDIYEWCIMEYGINACQKVLLYGEIFSPV